MLLKQSTSRVRMFYLGATGLTAAVTISKNGGAFGNPSAGATNATEVSGGWYKITVSTTDTATLGDLAYLFSTGTMDATFVDQVVLDLPGATISGDVTLNSLTVSTTTTLTGAVSAAAGVTLSALTVSGATALTGAVTMAAGLAITNSTSNGPGVVITGNGTGHGLSIISGNGATGNALNIAANSTNGVGLNVAGIGTGAGAVFTGGATGIGFSCVGGSSSGSGFKSVGSAGNAIGMEIAGQGSAAGFSATGGATGAGAKLVGGSSSGDGLLTATTSGHGFNLVCSGSSKHGIAGVVETGYDYTQTLQLIAAAVAGKCSISGDTVTYRDLADGADRIVATTDGDGQRSAVTKTVG